MTTAPAISDEEIRDWARATDRPVGAKGRISASLRAEYEALAAEAAAHPPADPRPPPGRGAESDSAGPAPAREETQPRKVATRATALRTRLWGPSGGARKKRKTRDRVPVEKLITRGWELGSRILQPVNLPVARCLNWQAPTAGALLEQSVHDTVVDKILQPFARAEDLLETFGALFGPPVLIFALQLPQNQPVREVEVVDHEGNRRMQQAPWPAGAMRHQVIMSALVEALDMCVEAQESLPEEVRQRQRHREQRRADMQGLIRDVFFAPPPGNAQAAAAEEEAMARARDKFRGA